MDPKKDFQADEKVAKLRKPYKIIIIITKTKRERDKKKTPDPILFYDISIYSALIQD